ncbi:DUF4192 family protein [Microbacterium halophytorum]|uniref:DUF4192 family protein n=1 Tax=Microbacterium halophytorum TaxID=2067568 RepID=UPI00131A1F03|nr:DUF4192 family protein [Microbacterium halophytorum]
MTSLTSPAITHPIRDAAAFLRAVPRLTGCTPVRSLVVVPLAGTTARGALRLDLPTPGADDQVAATAIGMACQVAGADAIAVVVYDGDAHWPPDGPLPREGLVDRVLDRAEACGLGVRGAYLVTADGWGAYGDAAPRPHAEIELRPGGGLDRDQHEGAAVQRAGKARRRAVAAELERSEYAFAQLLLRRAGLADPAASTAPAPADRAPGPRARPVDEASLPGLLDEALDWDAEGLDPADAGFLALVLSTPLLRDAALTQWSADIETGRTVLAWQFAWRPDTGAEQGELPNGVLRLTGAGEKPDPERLRRGLALARAVAAAAPGRARAGALASAAWLSWALGNATHAGAYAERARGMEPEHGLARIILRLVELGRLPAWAFLPGREADAT